MIWGSSIGVIQGSTRSLDYSSYAPIIPTFADLGALKRDSPRIPYLDLCTWELLKATGSSRRLLDPQFLGFRVKMHSHLQPFSPS